MPSSYPTNSIKSLKEEYILTVS